MLVGTDYNIGGIKGVGPKNALRLVRQFDHNFDSLFSTVKWDDYFDYPWQRVFDQIDDIPTTDDYDMEWRPVDTDSLYRLLVDKHDFSQDRVESTIKKIVEDRSRKKQKSLFDY
jgi:flap endonuclease-1